MARRRRDTREYARRMKLLRQRADARRQRMRWATSAISVVLLAFAVMVVVKLSGGGTGEGPAPVPTGAAAATVVAAATSVPAVTLDSIGAGPVSTLPKATTGQPVLAEGGKPVVLYVGAEYCPFCAAQRWPVVVALSRFGTFDGLRISASAADDAYPNTPTLSFHGSTYTSQYLVFQGVETNSNVREGSGYAPLDTLTAQQEQLVRTYNASPYVDAASAGAIPFLDYANQAVSGGASFSPQLLAGKTAEQVANALSNPDSEIGRAVGGNANAITALLCRLTKGQPGDVCSSKAVTAFRGKFDNVTVG